MKIPVFCIPQAVYYVYGMQRLIDSTIKLTIFMIFNWVGFFYLFNKEKRRYNK